ncbi:DUF4352 domain-containing protein [Staphylococcus lutrae]|uniref:DUF4352 domain-containing protein n=1 Tax=Staphylococcus lutrae TaxID=155085 RepID=A0AAC9WMU2_9STAP|nr:DUF4352 domain-containing protein [Staphylococcus lutrae]ARJ51587.1 hypothetical protein B5P37_09815 [Staphylococcus lutrae]PNZ34619.1 DUF4352 domain-containing protein [Staphylococcus lutrae]
MSEKNTLSHEELLAKQQQQFEAYKKEEASKNKKRWLWGCAGCLGAFIILVIIFSSCTAIYINQVNKDDTQQSTSKNNKQDQSKTKKSGKAEDNKKKVGETSEIDGIAFTLDSAKYTDERNKFADVEAEKVLKIDITVKNNSDTEIPVGVNTKLYVDGKQANAYPIKDQLFDSLSPGREISGSQGFAINGDAKKIELEFQPLGSTSPQRYIYEINPK